MAARPLSGFHPVPSKTCPSLREIRNRGNSGLPTGSMCSFTDVLLRFLLPPTRRRPAFVPYTSAAGGRRATCPVQFASSPTPPCFVKSSKITGTEWAFHCVSRNGFLTVRTLHFTGANSPIQSSQDFRSRCFLPSCVPLISAQLTLVVVRVMEKFMVGPPQRYDPSWLLAVWADFYQLCVLPIVPGVRTGFALEGVREHQLSDLLSLRASLIHFLA